MHAVKGSWVGQTFALSKNNESEGRKSRIRRSKEERKEMVESFIKRYQKLNSGSFPSLNLTHKEVGGSFYTVREIVRDVIQENRVLGPAKFNAEEQTIDQFLEHNPLGSIAAEPNNALSTSSNESQFDTNQNHGGVGQLVFASDGHLATVEHQVLENGKIINGTNVIMNDKEFFELKSAELQVNRPVETEKKVSQESVEPNGQSIEPDCQVVDNGLIKGIHEDLERKENEELTSTELYSSEALEAEKIGDVLATSGSKVTSIAADREVETFPLKPACGISKSLNGRLGQDLTIPTEDKETREMELAASVSSSPVDRVNSMADDNIAVENKSGSVGEEELGHAKDASLKSSSCSTFNEGFVQGKGNTDINVKAPNNDVPVSETFDQSQLTTGIEATEVPDGFHGKTITDTSGSSGLSKSEEVLMIEDEAIGQSVSSLQKGSNPTLDRINLESWERASKKSAKPAGNPLWDAFKAFFDAFVKFWSE